MSQKYLDESEDARGVRDVFAGYLAWMMPRPAAVAAANWIYRRIARDYARAGEPFGASHAGMMRWLSARGMGEVQRPPTG